MEVQDIKDELPNESWFDFDLYHCTRVGSREQIVNLLANSPSVVRVHAMVNLKIHEEMILNQALIDNGPLA